MMSYKEPLIFVSGLAVGSVVTWLAVKGKYKAQAQEEIDSVKEVYARINKEAIEKAAAAKNKPDISVYTEALKQARGNSEEEEETEPEEEPIAEFKEELAADEPVEEEPEEENYIYEITGTDFASSLNGHTKITIYYFTDDVYADEVYDQVDPKEYLNHSLVLLGSNMIVDPIDYIRRMPKDEICIRNYELKLDIDIATDARSYTEYMSS